MGTPAGEGVGRRFRTGPVRVTVPATSANLGPGFDSFGLALDLCDEVEVEVVPDRPGTVEVTVTGEGAGTVATDESNLVVRSLRSALEQTGLHQPGLVLRCLNRIPHARGLGSSAAAIVAGAAAAHSLVLDGADGADRADGASDDRDLVLDLEGIFRFAARAEGHPDNVAACAFGGLTVAWEDAAGRFRALPLAPPAGVRPIVLVPPEGVSTSRVRALLPPSVAHADAARNAGRAGLLVAALLTGRSDLLLDATEDRLHQAYRSEAMPLTWDAVLRLRAAGLPAVVSGAGPTVLVLAPAGGGNPSDMLPEGACPADWWIPRVSVTGRGVTARAVG